MMTKAPKPIDFNALRAEFPREDIHWRAQSVTKNAPYKALALAYIDARHVMERLDSVCGPDRWRVSHLETAKGRILSTIEILTENGWVGKSDGAGATDVEGDKGAISDALKRAAVLWGIGRYLYSMGAPWVPCEVNQAGKWKRWLKDPWEMVKDAPLIPELSPDEEAEPPLPGEPEARENLEGKHPSKSALKAALSELHSKIAAATTTREIDAIQIEYAADYEQATRYLPAWIEGDPSKPDSQGLASFIVRRRSLVWLIEGLKANDTVLERDQWYAANEAEIERLDDAQGREFQVAYDQFEPLRTGPPRKGEEGHLPGIDPE